MPIKIKGSYDTEIYVTEGGYVALKQIDQVDREEQIVVLAAHQLPAVINELQLLWEDRASWEFTATDDEADAKPSAKSPAGG